MPFGYGYGYGFGFIGDTGSIPPIPITEGIEYLLTEDLILFEGFNYVVNNASVTNGKLLNSNGTAYLPTALQYPQDGTLDLTDGKYIDTQIIIPQNTEFLINLSKNVVLNGGYDLVSIHAKANNTADVYYGDESTPPSLLPKDTGLNYTVPLTNYIITENLEVPIIPLCAIDTIANISGVGAVTINIDFNTEVLGFALSDISIDTPANGTFSNLVDVGWLNGSYRYTVDFTPEVDISDTTNVITVSGALGEYTDSWLNASDADAVSNNFEIDSVVTPFYNYRIAIDKNGTANPIANPTGISINHINSDLSDDMDVDLGAILVADNGTIGTGVLLTRILGGLASSGTDGIKLGDTEDNTTFGMYDTQLTHYWGVGAPYTLQASGLGAGTYTVKLSHSRNATAPSSRIGIDTVNGVTVDNIECYSTTSPTVVTFENIVVDGGTPNIDITFNKDEPNGGVLNYFNGIDIIRTA